MVYQRLPGLTTDGRLYEGAGMGTVEALPPTGGYPTAHAPAMLELPDGEVWAIYTAQLGRQPGKAAWPGLRCPVSVALSEDGGLTFPLIRWMERGEGFMGEENRTNNRQHEYPFILQGRDGTIRPAYAANARQGAKYVRFREEDVLGKKRERVGLYNPTAAQVK